MADDYIVGVDEGSHVNQGTFVIVIMEAATGALHILSEQTVAAGQSLKDLGDALERVHRRELPPPTIQGKEPVALTKRERRERQPWSKAQRNQPWNRKR